MVTNRPLHITLVISSLGAGGAERVMTILAGEWAKRGNRVTLITLASAERDHYAVPTGVHRVALDVLRESHGKAQALKNNYTRLSRLREAIRQSGPDVVVSFMDVTNILTLLATGGLRVPVIISERIDPRHYPIARGWAALRKLLYPQASALVVQTQAVARWAEAHVPAHKVSVIPNPVSVHVEAEPTSAVFPAGGYILAMGRLDGQKGFDLLLRAYAQLPGPSLPLVIVGEGPERAKLEALIAELDLGGRVTLPGRVLNPAAAFAGARLFVLSSRFDGFPNVLIEAMATGLPAVAFDCPSGPAEIIQHGENGMLVPPEDVGRLAGAMRELLADEALAVKLADKARNTSQKFSVAAVVDQWDALVSQILKTRG